MRKNEMTEVICGKDNCRHINGETCMLRLIELDDDGCCLEYSDYSNDAEYQTEYYIAVEACDGKHGRACRMGRKIVINEEVFFTQYSPCSDENHTYITHGRTGYYCGTVKHIKEYFEEFMRKQSDTPDVMSLPLVEFDDVKRKYIYVKEEEKQDDTKT